MSYLKLFTRIYTSVILLLIIIMSEPDINLQKLPATSGVFGLGFQFNLEHVDDKFKPMPHHMNHYYGD